jgi:hypothetical protein
VLCSQAGGRIDADVSRPASVDAPRTVEAAFGPEAGAEALIIRVIATAEISIRLAGFAFSSPVIVAELISKHRPKPIWLMLCANRHGPQFRSSPEKTKRLSATSCFHPLVFPAI